nr:hypothetical protein [Phenylobacterium sp.]
MTPNRFDAFVQLIADLLVGEAQYAIAFAFKPSLTFGVASRHVGQSLMDGSVNLDNQTRPVSGEIGEVAPDRRLPTEVRVQLAQFLPKLLFGPGRPSAQTSGAYRRAGCMARVLEHQAFSPCWAT